jgi:hypothetical protein
MKVNRDNGITFRYTTLNVIGIAVAPTIFAIILLCIVAAGFLQRSYINAAWELLFLIGIVFFIPGMSSLTAAVRVDEAGVSSHLFGIRTQQYQWEEIKRIRKTSAMNKSSMPNEFIDIIQREQQKTQMLYNAFGIIRISNNIVGYDRLKYMINGYIEMHKIPTFYVAESEARAQSSPNERAKWMNDGVPTDRI